MASKEYLFNLIKNSIFKNTQVYGPINYGKVKEYHIGTFNSVKTKISENIPQKVPELVPDRCE